MLSSKISGAAGGGLRCMVAIWKAYEARSMPARDIMLVSVNQTFLGGVEHRNHYYRLLRSRCGIKIS